MDGALTPGQSFAQPSPITLPPRQPGESAPVTWDWYIASPVFIDNVFQGFRNIGALKTAQNRVINLGLDSVESAAFTVSVLDDIADAIWQQTLINCLVCYRDGDIAWSGPLWTTKPTINATTDTLDVTCVGWFQYLIGRLLKCGVYGSNPMVGPTSTTSGTTHSYVAEDPTAIAIDLFLRTNFEYPLPISLGNIQPNPNGIQWNVTYQELQNIGQAIQTLSNVEGGFDFRVDPATLQLDLYYAPVKAGTTVYGRGVDRPNAVFQMPGNLSELAPTEDASVVVTQMTVLDQLSNLSQFPAPGEVTSSILAYGSWQGTQSLSDITSPTITTAYAESEVLALSAPETIWIFTPLGVHGDTNVPQPLVDYDIGDFVRLQANYGCVQVPSTGSPPGPAPVRMFAFTINISTEGLETITNVQTTYQQAS